MKILMLYLFVTPLFAQTYPMSWQGIFDMSNSDTLNPLYPSRVTFKLNWSETNKELRGTYVDDNAGGPFPLTGAITPNGRTFYVTFPQLAKGIKSLEMSSSETTVNNGQVPVSITVRNDTGATIATRNISAAMIASAPSAVCSIGFGNLTGYCGRYNGSTQESSDTNNLCNLATANNMTVELLPNTQVQFTL